MNIVDRVGHNQARWQLENEEKLELLCTAVNTLHDDQQPVTLTDAQLDRILALREPLSIPGHAAEQIATMAKHGNLNQRAQIGYGQWPLVADWTFSPDGSLRLGLFTMNGDPFWSGTFRGPKNV
jgi:hypothetical protein